MVVCIDGVVIRTENINICTANDIEVISNLINSKVKGLLELGCFVSYSNCTIITELFKVPVIINNCKIVSY